MSDAPLYWQAMSIIGVFSTLYFLARAIRWIEDRAHLRAKRRRER